MNGSSPEKLPVLASLPASPLVKTVLNSFAFKNTLTIRNIPEQYIVEICLNQSFPEMPSCPYHLLGDGGNRRWRYLGNERLLQKELSPLRLRATTRINPQEAASVSLNPSLLRQIQSSPSVEFEGRWHEKHAGSSAFHSPATSYGEQLTAAGTALLKGLLARLALL